MSPIVLLALASALGVLLPKVVPPLVVPERVPPRVGRALRYLAPALVGALAAGLAGGTLARDGRPATVIALALAGSITALTRRDLLAMILACAVLIAAGSP